MKVFKRICIALALCNSNMILASDYAIELSWNTENAAEVLTMLPAQKKALNSLIASGVIKDMYSHDSMINGQAIELVRFVVNGSSESDVRLKVEKLPMFNSELVKINQVFHLGEKWVDSQPNVHNYGVSFTWMNEVDSMEMDRVFGVDLQKALSMTQAGVITSSYINTQVLDNGLRKPTYTISFLAKDEKHALELSQEFEAVKLGYANIKVKYLGRKLDINR